MIDYKKECHAFIDTCFELMSQQKSMYSYNVLTKKLHYPFYLKINSEGKLSLWDSNHRYLRAHVYENKQATPITSIGILLKKYLELLEKEVDV